MTLKKHGKNDATPDDVDQLSGEPNSDGAENDIEGAIGIIMDVTEIKAKEAVLEAQAKEKQQLLANEAAAKEASRLKSQFLANVSIDDDKMDRALVDWGVVADACAPRCLMRFALLSLVSLVRISLNPLSHKRSTNGALIL